MRYLHRSEVEKVGSNLWKSPGRYLGGWNSQDELGCILEQSPGHGKGKQGQAGRPSQAVRTHGARGTFCSRWTVSGL